ncbi:MAG TPA: pitrilysin family protein [Abditibacteriaceae bacterium]|jgi:zinc protease
MIAILRKSAALGVAFAASLTTAWAAPEPAAETPKNTETPAAPASGEKPAAAAPVAKPAPASTVEKQSAIGNRALLDAKTISLRTLPNGVRSLVKETRGSGVVAVQVWVRAGSRYETANNAGVSRLIEGIALQNSKNYSRTKGGVEGALGGIGASVASQTTRDGTNYSATVAPAFFSNAVRALSDAVLNPRLTEAEVETAKLELEDDVNRREADPLQAVTDLAFRAGFAKHPYRFSPSGTVESLGKLRGKSVRDYYAARYVGSNISVVVVGDITTEAAHALVAQSFRLARAGKTTDAITPEVAIKPQTIVRKRPIARAATALAFRAPGIASPDDVVAMDVLLAHWSQGRDAALRRVLLNETGEETAATDDETNDNAPEPLALGFDVNFLTQRDAGLIVFTLVTEPDLRAAATKSTFDAIAAVRRDGLDAASLARAQRELKRQYLEQGETPTGQAGALGFYEMISTYEFATTYLDRIDRISNADVRRVAQKYFAPGAVIQATIDAVPPARPTSPLDSNETIPV